MPKNVYLCDVWYLLIQHFISPTTPQHSIRPFDDWKSPHVLYHLPYKKNMCFIITRDLRKFKERSRHFLIKTNTSVKYRWLCASRRCVYNCWQQLWPYRRPAASHPTLATPYQSNPLHDWRPVKFRNFNERLTQEPTSNAFTEIFV